jgi:hypothetical protein
MLKKLLKDQNATAAVELALVLPLLLLIVFAIINFGIIFHNLLTINAAAREGARWAALYSDTTTICDRYAATPNPCKVAFDYMKSQLIFSSNPPQASWPNTDTSPMALQKVTVWYNFNSVGWRIPGLMVPTLYRTSSSAYHQ